ADFLPGLARDCHAKEVSPILSSFASPVSRRALKFSQVRCVCHSATPAWPSYDRARCLILNILYNGSGRPTFTENRWAEPTTPAQSHIEDHGLMTSNCFSTRQQRFREPSVSRSLSRQRSSLPAAGYLLLFLCDDGVVRADSLWRV